MKIRKLSKHNPTGGLNSSLYSEDIIAEIFFWLPLKSLIRFKRLSKRWHFLISHKDSYFRHNYLSTLSTRRKNRIVGGGSDANDDSAAAIMAGFFYQKARAHCLRSYDPVRFLPTTSTQSKKYNIQQGEAGAIEAINDINPFCSLDKSLDNFLLSCLHKDPAHQNIFVVASSNGFLLCSLQLDYPETYYMVNPVTMEWVALPKFLETIQTSYVGFVCKGDYPSLDLVEYTIVRLSLIEKNAELVLEFFSSTGDNQWVVYSCSCESLLQVRFSLIGQPNSVIVSTAATSDVQGGEGGGIVVYFLVRIWQTFATVIVVIDLNKDDSLQMIETPGPDRGRSVIGFPDYIREFDAGVIHYVRFVCLTDFEFWVLNIETREWYLKHKSSLKTMMKAYPWSTQNDTLERYHIHAFHPMHPNLIFLSLNTRIVCYNIETGTFQLVYDFFAQKMLDYYCYYLYQWPCWPPLL